MNSTKRSAITLISLPLALASVNSLSQVAYAQEISLGVYPTTTEIEGKLGTATETTLNIKNSGKDSVTLTPLLQPFTAAQTENGEVQYQDHIPAFLKYVQVYADGAIMKEVTLEPGEEKNLILKILIPREEKPQDYYFSLIMLSEPSLPEKVTSDKNVRAETAISAGVASHVLLSIEPKAIREVKLVDFSSPLLSRESKVSFRVRVTNESQNFTKVGGKITVENFLGNAIEDMEISQTLVLSRSTRLLTERNDKLDTSTSSKANDNIIRDQRVMQKDLFPGIYRATLSLYGEKLSYPIHKTIYFVVAPVEIFVTGIMLFLVLYLVKKRLKQKMVVS